MSETNLIDLFSIVGVFGVVGLVGGTAGFHIAKDSNNEIRDAAYEDFVQERSSALEHRIASIQEHFDIDHQPFITNQDRETISNKVKELASARQALKEFCQSSGMSMSDMSKVLKTTDAAEDEDITIIKQALEETFKELEEKSK